MKSLPSSQATNPLQKAVLEARERTGIRYSTPAKQGKLKIVIVTYNDNGTSNIEDVTDYMEGRKVIEKLNSL